MGKVKDILIEAEELGLEVNDDTSFDQVQAMVAMHKATADYTAVLEDLSDLLDNAIEEQQSIITTLTGVKSFIKKGINRAK